VVVRVVKAMSTSASEEKARQRRIRNVTRQVIQKAYLQRIKDELRAEQRRKVRKERQREEVGRDARETIQREQARRRAEYKDLAVVLCSFFLSVVYFFSLRSFFLDETKEGSVV
jgi:hypothetical protein